LRFAINFKLEVFFVEGTDDFAVFVANRSQHIDDVDLLFDRGDGLIIRLLRRLLLWRGLGLVLQRGLALLGDERASAQQHKRKCDCNTTEDEAQARTVAARDGRRSGQVHDLS
jgi:hypothetical protein